MAKKVVATLKKEGSASFTKVIRMKKKSSTGAYTFEEKVINKDLVSDFLKN